jgi:hypothetical protein
LQSDDLEEAWAAHEAAAADARELHCANAALGGKVCTELLTTLYPFSFRGHQQGSQLVAAGIFGCCGLC